MAPFPYLPMVAILASLVSYLVVQMSVFSYAGYMVEYLGVVDDKDKAGYYAGLLSSAFMIGRLFSSHFWGLVADRYGCRLVMVVGLFSTAVLSIAFGASTTFTWAFIFRFLLGLLNGMIAASKTLVSEVCGKEHETVGMGVVTTSWSLGTLLGPGVGGLLAEPAKHHPLTFSQRGVFGRHPYLLPNVVGAGLALLSLPLVLVFLKGKQHADSIVEMTKARWPFGDTNNDDDGGGGGGGGKAVTKVGFHSIGDANDDDNDDDDDGNACGKANHDASAAATTTVTSAMPPQKKKKKKKQKKPLGARRKPSWLQIEMTTSLIDKRNGRGQVAEQSRCGDGGDDDVKLTSLLAQPHIRTLLVIDGLYSFAYSGFDEVYTLWALSTVAKGGLDWSSPQIGQVFLICGLMVLVFEIFGVPNITPRLGVRMSQRVGSVFELPVYLLFPLLSRMNGADFPVTIATVILLFTCYVSSNSFYVGVALAFNNATGPDRRGELNGLSATVGSFARAISPILCSALFAFSIDGNGNGNRPFPFDYHLGFYFIGLLRLAVACMGWNTINDTEGVERFGTETSEASESTLDECVL